MRATIRLTINLTRALGFTAQTVLGLALSLSLSVYTYIYICLLLCLCNVRGFQGLHRISAGLEKVLEA